MATTRKRAERRPAADPLRVLIRDIRVLHASIVLSEPIITTRQMLLLQVIVRRAKKLEEGLA